MEQIKENARQFLDLIQKSRRGRFKLYVGMSAGVGKTYRMLQEAHSLLRQGVDVKIGYIETHRRAETHALLTGLPEIPRRHLFYKGKDLEELDTDAILALRPEVVLVDELAHSNIEGSRNPKRYQDVADLLAAGISVISAVNIQHIESLHEAVKAITGIDVTERIPDSVLKLADEVVNIDLPADELITRLKEGKIYQADKIQTALSHFFQEDHILQLRELALKEVAAAVERKVEIQLPRQAMGQERFLACISSNEQSAKKVIRKTARLATYYQSKWYTLFVETPRERPDKIPLDRQRKLINNMQLATELGSEIIKVQAKQVAAAIVAQAEIRNITTICIGKPHLRLLQVIAATNVFNNLLKKLGNSDIDVVILS
jgi:two-component system sensor histidine kinase KdpD